MTEQRSSSSSTPAGGTEQAGEVIVNEQLPLIASKNTTSSLTTTSSSQQQQQQLTISRRVFQGRVLLFVVALIYGSLNVSLRIVYDRPGPPTASAISTTRGWLAVLCFLPLLRFANLEKAKKQQQRQQQQQQEEQENAIEGTTDNSRDEAVYSSNGDTTTAVVSRLTDHDEYEKEITTITPTRFMFWRFALELAFFNFGTQGLINVGLVTIDSSARASFLTQLSVVITPVLSAIFGHSVHCRVWIACVIALIGLYVLSVSHANKSHEATLTTSSNESTHKGIGLSIGDFYCLGGAFCWSYYIYRLSEWGDFFDEMETQFWKNIFLASMYTCWLGIAIVMSPASLWPGISDWISWITLFYSAMFPCTIADILQQKAQAVVTAAESNVIMSLEPVFTAILGLILLREGLTWQEIVGGGIIIVASVLAST